MLLAATFAACTQRSAPDSKVGYVRMEDLVKIHPLYAQLAHVDDGIAALQLRGSDAGPGLSPEEISRQEGALNRQLEAAAARVRKELSGKQREYAQRESAAMRALLSQANLSTGAPAGSIPGEMNATQTQQARSAAGQAGKDFEAYRQAVVKSSEASLQALRTTLATRADAQYRARLEQYQQEESNLSLQQSRANAPERLSLHTRLSNLALDDAARAQARARLDELDREDADALGAMRNRHQAELLAYHQELANKLQSEMNARAEQIRNDTVKKLSTRQEQMQRDLMGQIGAGGAISAGPALGSYPPDVRTKMQELHQQYQSDFDKEAKRTLDDFGRAKEELSKRYALLHGVDVDAEAATQKELDALQKQRSDLYDQIVAEIDSEVRVIAQRRGLSVVVGDVVAPAGGVDLTSDAAKAVENIKE